MKAGPYNLEELNLSPPSEIEKHAKLMNNVGNHVKSFKPARDSKNFYGMAAF